MSETRYANGSVRTWDAFAERLQRFLGDGAEVCVSEGTDWNEPGTSRHGHDYWFLVVLDRTPDHRLSAWLEKEFPHDCYGCSEDEDEKGAYIIVDFMPACYVREMRATLRRMREVCCA